ncbi:SCP2 sterol-binding domain-containing protein [Mortierella sp. GBAus27b]|nr:SCP2 sterol-binding domain-containing protein [Mortierella sp. GBAus27b]
MAFQSEDIFNKLNEALDMFDSKERQELVKQVNGVFEFHIKKDASANAEVKIWHAEVKNQGVIKAGPAPGNPEITLFLTDEDMDFVELFMGKVNGQKAFMTGRIKVKGAIMLALKLDTMMKDTQEKIGFFGQGQAKL